MKSGVLARGGEPVAGLGTSRIIRWTYCLLVFLLPFENLDLGLLEILGSTSKILGVILIVLIVGIRGLHIRRPPAAFVCFSSYLAFLTVSGLLHDQDYFSRALTGILYPLFQLIIFFYITYNILHDRAMIRATAAATALSCTLVSLQLSRWRLPGAVVRGDGMVVHGDKMTGGPLRAGEVEKESALTTIPIPLAHRCARSGWQRLSGYLMAQLDRFIVASFFGAQEYAIYVNGARELPVISVLTGSVMAVLTPSFVQLYHQGRRRGDHATMALGDNEGRLGAVLARSVHDVICRRFYNHGLFR